MLIQTPIVTIILFILAILLKKKSMKTIAGKVILTVMIIIFSIHICTVALVINKSNKEFKENQQLNRMKTIEKLKKFGLELEE